MPIGIRRDGVGENLERKGGDGFLEIGVPEIVAEGGEKKRSGLAGDATEGKEDAGDDTARGGFHDDMNRGFPAGNAEGERSLAIALGDKEKDLLRGSHDERNHEEPKGETASVGGIAFHGNDDETIDHDAPDD